MALSRSIAWGLVFSVVCSASQVLAQDSREVGMRDAVEAQLSKWKRGKENEAALALHQKDIVVARDISGVWLRDSGMDSTKLKLFSVGPNVYKIILSTGGCLGHWTLERTGVYKDGVLLLNRPLEEYTPLIYDRLFTIRTPAGVRLISEAALGWYREEHGAEMVSVLMFKNTTQSSATIMASKKPEVTKKQVAAPASRPSTQPLRL